MILNHPRYGQVTEDSRLCGPKVAFLAHKHNQKFWQQAVQKHAQILSVSEVFGSLATRLPRVVGITGTNGKTTTAAAVYSLLLDLGHGVGMQGTRGFFVNDTRIEEKSLTTPSLLQTLSHIQRVAESGCDFFVMEVSSHAIDQGRIEGIAFALKILTNLTSDHLDYHGTVEKYHQVKNSFFADETVKLINRDEKHARFNSKNAFGYGVENPATYKIAAYSFKDGISGVVKYLEEAAAFESSLVGLFNLYNLTAAIAAVHLLTRRPIEEICQAMENYAGVSGRMEVVGTRPLIVVDFAHTHDGIAKVMEAFSGRKIRVVFGAGGDRDRSKRPLMAKAVGGALKAYVTSDNPRGEDPHQIMAQIVAGFDKDKQAYEIIESREEAIKKAIDETSADEVLLILGKGDETYQEVAGVKTPFDDREVVRAILRK